MVPETRNHENQIGICNGRLMPTTCSVVDHLREFILASSNAGRLTLRRAQ